VAIGTLMVFPGPLRGTFVTPLAAGALGDGAGFAGLVLVSAKRSGWYSGCGLAETTWLSPRKARL
jgi:hypothetical protein